MTLFVTRPAPDAERTVAALAAAGVDAAPAPLMEIVPTGAALPTVAENAILAITSANGIRAWAEAGGPLRPVMAVGDASAREAEELGYPVEAVAGGDVDALFADITAKAAGRPVLHVRGVHGRGHLTRRLADHGLKAKAAELYEARALNTLPPALADAITEGGHMIGVFSPRTMKLLLELVERAGLSGGLGSTRAICLSEAIAEAGKQAGFQSVHGAVHPELAAFVDTALTQST